MFKNFTNSGRVLKGGFMSNFYNASEYKNKIINLLLKNKDFIKLIDPKPSECDQLDIIDVLIGGEWIVDGKNYYEQGHVFDYNFVDDTTTDEKTFVFVETDVDNVTNNTFVDFNLYICVFSNKRLLRLTTTSSPTVQEVKDMGYFAGTVANRIDILCDIIDKTINGSKKICGIGKVTPSTRGFCTVFCPNINFYGKCLKYKITNLNDIGDECID